MPLIFHIPAALREFTGGHSTVELDGSAGTVGDALARLWAVYPGVRDRLTNDQGELRQHVNVFIGNENIRYTGGLASPLADGAEITVVPAISGGSGS